MSEFYGAGLILLAASFVAFQRMFIKTSGDRMVLLVGVNLVSSMIAVLAMPWVPALPMDLLPYLALSSAFYCAAMYFLLRAYRTGDFGIITPAQGALKAAIIAVLAVLVLGENANRYHLIALVLLLAGFLVQVPWEKSIKDDHFGSLGLSLLIGGASAAQYTVDVFVVRAVEAPLSYIVWNLLIGLPIIALGCCTRGARLWSQICESGKNISWSAGLDIAGYGLVLLVAHYLSLLFLIPLLNLDIVFATLIAAFVLREPFPGRRIFASILLALSAITVLWQ